MVELDGLIFSTLELAVDFEAFELELEAFELPQPANVTAVNSPNPISTVFFILFSSINNFQLLPSSVSGPFISVSPRTELRFRLAY